MLEKKQKKDEIIYCDSHFHPVQCYEKKCDGIDFNWIGCACFLFREEFISFESIGFKNKIYKTFGVHPQFVNVENIKNIKSELDFLIQLCEEKRISAIGEIGFDLFTDEYKKNENLQNEIFKRQLDVALKYNLPIVIHCRKGNPKLFEYAKELKKLPAVQFHSFMGSVIEAQALINKGINAYFSFGKQLLNNNKNARKCFAELPIENLLLETDAPYQFLKGEDRTFLQDIKTIYDEAYLLRKENHTKMEFCNKIFENLLYLYHE